MAQPAAESSSRGTHPRKLSQTRSLPKPTTIPKTPLKKLFRVTSIACGIQFGWALQLSLLTPYVQELGIPHAWASLIWLCGPLSGLFVQPLVGHSSDKCMSKFGRRRPFIVAGAGLIVVSVLVIGHAADIGGVLGDKGGESGGVKWRSILTFVIGFWILDVANNVTQGPCRALLADLTGSDQRRNRIANAYFSLFMAVGNVLGYATSSYSGWYKLFPFTVTSNCSINCANLKSAFFLDIAFIVFTTCLSISAVPERPLESINRNIHDPEQPQEEVQEAFMWELFGVFRYLSTPVWIIFIVTALTWTGWFPFILFDTDWMGREIYKGEPNVGESYNAGVRMGAFGLMINSVVLGLTSVLIEKLCKKWGGGIVLGISNIIMFLCFIATIVISFIVKKMEFPSDGLPPTSIVVASLIVFTVLGAPLAVTYSVPYAMISSRTSSLGLGQGLSMGILNLAIVIPQIVVSVGAGPWDQLFGGGNSPAFAVAAFAAFAGGLVSILGLPRSHEKPRTRL